VKKTTLVAWVGAEPLLLAYFGIDHACPPHEPIRAPFPPRIPPAYFYYVLRNWMLNPRFRGCPFLTQFGTHLPDIFEWEITQNAHLTNCWVWVSLQSFCNDFC